MEINKSSCLRAILKLWLTGHDGHIWEVEKIEVSRMTPYSTLMEDGGAFDREQTGEGADMKWVWED